MKVNPFARLSRPAVTVVKWSAIALGVLAVIPLMLMSTRGGLGPTKNLEPIRSLPLTVTGEGERFSVFWDVHALAVQDGECGTLRIRDGGMQRRLILDESQLRAGKLFYWPAHQDVSFEIKVSAGNQGSSESACSDKTTFIQQPAERPAAKEQWDQRTVSRNRLNTIHITEPEQIEFPQSGEIRGYANERIGSSEASVPTIEGASQPAASLPVHNVMLEALRESDIPFTVLPLLRAPLAPYSIVTVESARGSRLSRLVAKIPLVRGLHRTREFSPPIPVRETNPVVPAELGRTLKEEVPLDVRAYINEMGKVTFAEILSNVTEANRDFAGLAVFDARHREFIPAQIGGQTVPGRLVLHYRFGNPLLAIAGDQR